MGYNLKRVIVAVFGLLIFICMLAVSAYLTFQCKDFRSIVFCAVCRWISYIGIGFFAFGTIFEIKQFKKRLRG